MSWCIFPVTAQKLRSPCLSSQDKLWTLNYNFRKSLLVLGSLISDADGNARRTEEVRGGEGRLGACSVLLHMRGRVF